MSLKYEISVKKDKRGRFCGIF